MRIQFKTEGGFAHFPGLSRPTTINSEDLPPAEARRLQKLVQAIDTTGQKESAATGADYQSYTIQIETAEESYTVRASEPVADPSLQELVDFLRGKMREQLRAKGRNKK